MMRSLPKAIMPHPFSVSTTAIGATWSGTLPNTLSLLSITQLPRPSGPYVVSPAVSPRIKLFAFTVACRAVVLAIVSTAHALAKAATRDSWPCADTIRSEVTAVVPGLSTTWHSGFTKDGAAFGSSAATRSRVPLIWDRRWEYSSGLSKDKHFAS